MSKRPKKSARQRPTPTTAERARREEKQQLRRALKGEREIQWLARKLRSSVAQTDRELETLGGILRERFIKDEPAEQPQPEIPF